MDFESQIVGDDCWSSFTDTTWMENKSLNQIISPDSSRRNLIPFNPRFSERLESSESMIWNEIRNFKQQFSWQNRLCRRHLPVSEERMIICGAAAHFSHLKLMKLLQKLSIFANAFHWNIAQIIKLFTPFFFRRIFFHVKSSSSSVSPHCLVSQINDESFRALSNQTSPTFF